MEKLFSAAIILLFINCSKPFKPMDVQLKILDKEVRIDSIRVRPLDSYNTNYVTIKYRLINATKKDILLYNPNGYVVPDEYEGNETCDSLWGVADWYLYVHRLNGERIMPDSHTLALPFDGSIKSSYDQGDLTSTFIRSKIVIKKGDSIAFEGRLSFRDYDLSKGSEYIVKVLFIQNDVLKMISKDQLQNDSRELNAYLFKGCLWSNSVKLIVE
jgi:hypothetical protein